MKILTIDLPQLTHKAEIYGMTTAYNRKLLIASIFDNNFVKYNFEMEIYMLIKFSYLSALSNHSKDRSIITSSNVSS